MKIALGRKTLVIKLEESSTARLYYFQKGKEIIKDILSTEEVDLIKNYNSVRIRLIKEYRAKTFEGIGDAKDLIDNMFGLKMEAFHGFIKKEVKRQERLNEKVLG